jgi:hypothetical protein
MDYIKEPLYVSVINLVENNIFKNYYFLGNVPNAVLNAARNGIINEKTKRVEWKSKDDRKILSSFYGSDWQQKLTNISENALHTHTYFNIYGVRYGISGGAESKSDIDLDTTKATAGTSYGFGDLSILDDDTMVQNEMSVVDLDSSESKIVYSNVSVYPEDNLYDLRLKIQLLTKIPIYRQFMFYFVNNQGPYYTFSMSINKVPYAIRWDGMLQTVSSVNICGIHIDPYFEQNKNSIDVISYDLSRLVEHKKGYRINKVFIIDLYDILKDRNVKSIINDKYQFDLLYYGFIIKYWPQLTSECFKLAITNINAIPSKLNTNFDTLYRNQSIEQDLINKTYKFIDNNIYTTIINEINIYVNPNAKLVVNIRNVFDLLELNNNVYAMFINIKQGIRKYVHFAKYHASVMNNEFIIDNPKDSISLCIKGSNQIIINIFSYGSYSVLLKFADDDKITFNNITDLTSKYVNPIIEKINTFGMSVFPSGGKFALLKNNTDFVFNNMALSIYYPCILSLTEFNQIKNELEPYEKINIVRSSNIQVPSTYSFTFLKGMIDPNYVGNEYTWLYNDFNENGRYVKLIHKIDRLQIKLLNIKNINEFNIIKRYILTLVQSYIKKDKIKTVKKVESNVKSIRKLKDLDPDLFYLQKYSSEIEPYSVSCQSKRQPTILDESEIKYLSKDKQSQLIKYWNFTYSKPAYYLCSNKYPYINFITDRHPKGYCLPCCKKLKDTPGTKVSEINEGCLKERIYSSDTSSNAYILSYGKKLVLGRLYTVPSELLELLNKGDYYIYGVTQTSDISTTNYGFIYSLLFTLGDDCIYNLAELAKSMEQYYTLGHGKASKYRSSDALSADIIYNFGSISNDILINTDIETWTHILIDLVRYKYNVEVLIITISKLNDRDTFHLQSYSDSYVSIGENDMDIILLINDFNGINPVVQKRDTKGSKYNTIFKSSTCKHFFKRSKSEIMDIRFLMQFCKDSQTYKINTLYINNKNLCYGVLLSNNDIVMYIPVLESIIPYNNDIELSYTVRSSPVNSRNHILDFINAVNKYNKDSITIKYDIKHNDAIIGIMSSDYLCYYHTKSNTESYPVIEFPYDPLDIDTTIQNNVADNSLSKEAIAKHYDTNLYKLLLSEFIYIIQKERNDSIRNGLIHTVKITNFMDSKSINTLIKSFNVLLKNYPSDLSFIYRYIEYVYFNSIEMSDVINFINNSKFEFDFIIIEELRKMDTTLLIQKVKKLLSGSIVYVDIFNVGMYNIYEPCSSNDKQFFCQGSKLKIPNSKADDLFDVLCNDILNKNKIYSILLGNSNIIDYFDFIKRPAEFIKVLKDDSNSNN